MGIRNLSPVEAHAFMAKESAHVFIDVRTATEYSQGHPAGALNIPWAIPDPRTGMMQPSPGFVEAVREVVTDGKAIVVSCQSGGRSMGACRDLEAAGLADLVNVDGGFGGRRDPSGRVVPGWQAAGLPVER